MTTPDEDVEAVLALVSAVKPFFAGKSPEVQGAALADLTALWVAGHVTSNPARQHDHWARVLALHIEGIRKLISVNYTGIGIIERKLREKRESEREHRERDSGADGADSDDAAPGEPSGA
jgi:hypothetical protein